MVLNLAQRVFRYAKMRNFFQFARTMPVLNTILLRTHDLNQHN